MSYVIPILLLFTFVFSAVKKVKIYDVFTNGAKQAIDFTKGLFPYLVSILVLTNLFETSGLSNAICNLLHPVFKFLQIPEEVFKLVLIKPFSGSGSLAIVSQIYNTYGVDGYIARCASAIYGSSETVFYISAVYFASCKKQHKLIKPIIISLVASLFSSVFACFICRIL